MLQLTLPEAQLFRMAGSFFGKDRVVLKMSVLCICGGELPKELDSLRPDLLKWAKSNTCFLTVIDHEANPRMVIEFFSGFEDSIDVTELEHQRFLKPILEAIGVSYVTISAEEFDALLSPTGNLDFFSLIRAKFSHGEFEST